MLEHEFHVPPIRLQAQEYFPRFQNLYLPTDKSRLFQLDPNPPSTIQDLFLKKKLAGKKATLNK